MAEKVAKDSALGHPVSGGQGHGEPPAKATDVAGVEDWPLTWHVEVIGVQARCDFNELFRVNV